MLNDDLLKIFMILEGIHIPKNLLNLGLLNLGLKFRGLWLLLRWE